MNEKKTQRVTTREQGRASASLLFQAWRDAASEWRRLKSDPAEAKCRAARRDYYLSAWGEVPALPTGRQGMSDLPPRELARKLLLHDSYRAWISDPKVPLSEVVNMFRRGGAGWSGPGYDVQVRGTHVEVACSQGEHHSPPIRFTTYELVKEMRAEALAAAEQPAVAV